MRRCKDLKEAFKYMRRNCGEPDCVPEPCYTDMYDGWMQIWRMGLACIAINCKLEIAVFTELDFVE